MFDLQPSLPYEIPKDQPRLALTPPLRWAGSKKWLLPYLEAFRPRNFRTYFEPFAGSAAFFFHLSPQRAILGDRNRGLIEFYSILATHPHEIFDLTSKLGQSKEQYYSIRSEEIERLSPVDRAVRFYYLNRMCFNGLYRTDSKGSFNVPLGSKLPSFPSIERLLAASEKLKKAQLVCHDFSETIENAQTGDFVYLDPPYFTDSSPRPNEYGPDSFCPTDIPRLLGSLEALNKRGVKFMVSLDTASLIPSDLAPVRLATLSPRRRIAASHSKRAIKTEVLISNYRP